MADAINVLGISGSLRAGSFNSGLLRAAASVLPPNMEMTTFPLHDIPLFNADVEAQGNPAPVTALQQAIGEADGLLFAVPEYNYSITGVLKNAFDWASRGRPSTLDGKPAAVMGVGGRSGHRARPDAHAPDRPAQQHAGDDRPRTAAGALAPATRPRRQRH